MVTVRHDDVFLVSYPKSGNTWTRFLLGNIIDQRAPVDFSNVELIVPDIYANSDADLLKIESPRTLKSHEYFDPRYKKVIYIVRDPRDVVVSYYHHAVKFGKVSEDYPIAQFVERFINGDVDRYGSWHENVASWLYTRGGDNTFMMLRYEDILANTQQELRKVANFLALSRDDEQLDRAIELSSKENMQRLEKEQSLLWNAMRNTRTDKPFVRSGKSGGWRSELPASCAKEIAARWARIMSALDYQ